MKRRFQLILKTLLIPTIIFIFVGVFGLNLLNKIYYGPSQTARNLFVSSVMETHFGQFIAKWFLPQQTINEILSGEKIYDFNEPEENKIDIYAESQEITVSLNDEEKQLTELVEIRGSTYRGIMMIVNDPSRVTVATSYPFEENGKGLKLVEMAQQNEAIAAINGGSFLNVGGDMPIGIAISNGKILLGESGREYNIIGFTNEDVLFVGRLDYDKIVSMGFRDAVSFSPVLVKNGQAADISQYASGLNPRSAIGQREDGAVLLLVIDGRQPHSLGANYQDLTDIMLEYGAVNAATLDGGSSSILVYENEIITNCCSLYGPGRIPTGFIVK